MQEDALSCPRCGGAMSRRAARFSGEFRGEKYTIKAEAMICAKCRFKAIPGAEMPAFHLSVADLYRTRRGLLTSGEIRSFRAALGMNQSAFARFLKVGEASVKRWESGQIQEDAMDELIRLKCCPDYAMRAARTSICLVDRAAKPRTIRQAELAVTYVAMEPTRGERVVTTYGVTGSVAGPSDPRGASDDQPAAA